MIKKPNAVAALTTAALSMPGVSAADTQPSETRVSLRTSVYEEDNIPQRDIVFGSDHRYEIDIHQFHLLTPVADNWSFELSAVREVMSGASPWGTVENADGDIQLIMSGATIEDTRDAYSLDVTRYYDGGSMSVGASHSKEDDYESNSARLSLDFDLNEKLTTVSLGASYSNDDVEPSDAEIFNRVEKESRDSTSAFVSLTQVVDRNTLLQLGVTGTRQSGYLSDPYKLRDNRGSERWQWAFSSRLRKFVDRLNGALHLGYRYYQDTFDVRSHTLEGSWYQNWGRLEIVPTLRYYAQREADFFLLPDDFTLPVTKKQTSDFRLSSYGAVSGTLKGTYSFDQWRMSISVERYVSRESFSPFSNRPEHPGLIDFTLVSVGWEITL